MQMSSEKLRTRKRLGEILKEAGLVSESQLRTALEDGRIRGARLGHALVARGFVDEETLMLALSRQLNLQPVDLDCAAVAPSVVKALNPEVASRYGVFPLSVNRRQRLLRVATSDPTNEEAQAALATHTGMRIVFSVSAPSSIDRAIRRHYYGEDAHGLAALESSELLPRGVTQVNLAFEWPSGPSAEKQARTDAKLEGVGLRMAQLEKMVAQQSFALRGMLELLDTKGVIRRDEFLARMNPGAVRKPPPLPLRRTSAPKARLPTSMFPPEPS